MPETPPAGSRRMPNLTLITALSRLRPLSASRSSISLRPMPYQSPVSSSLTPASSAAWIVAMLSASSAGPYRSDIPMHPSPIADTSGPFLPSLRTFIDVPPRPRSEASASSAPPLVAEDPVHRHVLSPTFGLTEPAEGALEDEPATLEDRPSGRVPRRRPRLDPLGALLGEQPVDQQRDGLAAVSLPPVGRFEQHDTDLHDPAGKALRRVLARLDLADQAAAPGRHAEIQRAAPEAAAPLDPASRAMRVGGTGGRHPVEPSTSPENRVQVARLERPQQRTLPGQPDAVHAGSTATHSAVRAQVLRARVSSQSWYFAASSLRAASSSSPGSTVLARAACSSSDVDPIRTVTEGSAMRFRTQSLRSPPPLSMYSARPSSGMPNQISMV